MTDVILRDEKISCRIDASIILQHDPSISEILLGNNIKSFESIVLFYESTFHFRVFF